MEYYIEIFLIMITIYWSAVVTPQLNAQNKNPCPDDCKNRNTTVKPRKDINYGYFTNLCGKEYFFGSEAKIVLNTADVLERCCELGMWGLSLESYKEQECIIDHLIAMRFAGYYLTSGLRENAKFGNKYRWCGTKNNIPIVAEKGQWGPGEPNHIHPIENYVILMLKDTKGLYDWTPENFKFICESDGPNIFPAKRNTSGIAYLSQPDITCPNLNCSANINFTALDIPETVEETSSGYIVKGCDTMFYVGKTRVNQSEASAECCKLGMKLVSINAIAKMDCIIKDMRKKIPTLDIGWASAIVTSRNFYTLEPKFSWCGEKSIPFSKRSNMWARDEPAGWMYGETCIGLDVNVPNRRGLRDDKCSIHHFPLCEVPEFVIEELELDEATDEDVSDKQYQKCNEYDCTPPTLNTTNSTQVLMSGSNKELCGKLFYFSEISLLPKEASNWCCKLGMTLASVESVEKQICILNFMKIKPSPQPMLTSGFRMDETDFRNVRWCAGPKNDKDFLITRQQWAQVEPNTSSKERCIGLKHNGTVFGLGINQCNQSIRFICEAPCSQQGTVVTEGQVNFCPPPTLPPTTTPPPCVTRKPISLDARCIVQNCTLNKTFAVSSPNNSNISPELGTLIHGSHNMSYFFSNDMMNYVDAEMTCCQLGMQLLELSKPQILLKAITSFYKLMPFIRERNGTNNENENWNTTQRSTSSTNVTQELVRPKESSNETKELVRPKESYNETKELVRPKESYNETKELVRPKESHNETKELVRPKESYNETKELVRPKESYNGTKELVRPKESYNEAKELVRPKESYNCTHQLVRPKELTQELKRNCEIATQNKSNATIENKIQLVPIHSSPVREKYGKNETVEIEIKILTKESLLKKEQNLSNETNKNVLKDSNDTKGINKTHEQFLNSLNNGTVVQPILNNTDFNGTAAKNETNVPNTLNLEADYWIGARRGEQICSKHFWWCSGGDAMFEWPQNRKVSLDCMTADVRGAKIEFTPELCANSNFFICQIEHREITTTVPTPVDILNIMALNFLKINKKTTPKPKKQ